MRDQIVWGIGIVFTLLLILFLKAIFVVPFQLYRGAHKEIGELRNKLMPKLLLECGRHVFGSCVRTTRSEFFTHTEEGSSPYVTSSFSSFTSGILTKEVMYFRVAVKAQSVDPVTGCSGRIERIFKVDGRPLNDEPIEIPFAPGRNDDALAKNICEGKPEYLDVLYITEDNLIHPPIKKTFYPASIKFGEIFGTVGEYYLTIVVSGDNTVSAHTTLRFNWTGDWQTAELSCLMSNI
ncbi:MAG TPA: hypothetical protein VN285_01340 [Candidatus Deferrimicrobium sp.]|nr:hypothetical protein [Candidatus Deferrimicrobium sp.]